MGSDESYFNVSLIERDKVTRQCPQTATFEVKGEPKQIQSNRCPSAYQPDALPLGQTGSVTGVDDDDDVGLYVLGCRVDILGTNCTKLLKVKMSGGGGGVRESLWLQYV